MATRLKENIKKYIRFLSETSDLNEFVCKIRISTDKRTNNGRDRELYNYFIYPNSTYGLIKNKFENSKWTTEKIDNQPFNIDMIDTLQNIDQVSFDFTLKEKFDRVLPKQILLYRDTNSFFACKESDIPKKTVLLVHIIQLALQIKEYEYILNLESSIDKLNKLIINEKATLKKNNINTTDITTSILELLKYKPALTEKVVEIINTVPARGLYACAGRDETECGSNPNCLWQTNARKCVRQKGHLTGTQYQGPIGTNGFGMDDEEDIDVPLPEELEEPTISNLNKILLDPRYHTCTWDPYLILKLEEMKPQLEKRLSQLEQKVPVIDKKTLQDEQNKLEVLYIELNKKKIEKRKNDVTTNEQLKDSAKKIIRSMIPQSVEQIFQENLHLLYKPRLQNEDKEMDIQFSDGQTTKNYILKKRSWEDGRLLLVVFENNKFVEEFWDEDDYRYDSPVFELSAESKFLKWFMDKNVEVIKISLKLSRNENSILYNTEQTGFGRRKFNSKLKGVESDILYLLK
jgi:hypothetical protein